MAQTRKCTDRDIDAGGNCRCGCGFNSDDFDDYCTGAFGEMCYCWDCGESDLWSAERLLGLRARFDDPTVPQATIDKIAKALFHRRSPLASWDDAPDWRQERYRDMARVAIREIREG